MIMHRKPACKQPTPEQIQNARYLHEIIGDNVAERMNEVTATIFAQMGGNNLLVPGVKKPYAIAGKHNEGGLLIELDQAIAKERGTFFIVSYDYGADTYTVHYFRKASDTPQAFDLLYEAEDIYCDMLCEVFARKTGIEIPPVEFGPAVITDLDQ